MVNAVFEIRLFFTGKTLQRFHLFITKRTFASYSLVFDSTGVDIDQSGKKSFKSYIRKSRVAFLFTNLKFKDSYAVAI